MKRNSNELRCVKKIIRIGLEIAARVMYFSAVGRRPMELFESTFVRKIMLNNKRWKTENRKQILRVLLHCQLLQVKSYRIDHENLGLKYKFWYFNILGKATFIIIIIIIIIIIVGLVVSMSDYWSWGRGFDPRHFHKL